MRRLRLYILGLLISFLVVLLFNYKVDPLHRFRSPEFGPYFSSERHYKKQLVKGSRPEILILGSSVVTAINPRMLLEVDLNIFNAAFSAAFPEEMEYFINTFSPDVPIYFFGIDFPMFNESWQPIISSVELTKQWHDSIGVLATYLSSVDTLIYSLRAVFKWALEVQPLFDLNGGRFRGFGTPYISHDDLPEHDRVLHELENVQFRNFKASKDRVQVLERLNIRNASSPKSVIFFLNPLSSPVRELIENSQVLKREFHRIRFELKALLAPNFVDFTSYEELRIKDCYFKDDPLHYTRECGLVMLQELLKFRDRS